MSSTAKDRDAFGTVLSIGDTVAFISAPNTLQRGTIVSRSQARFATILNMQVDVGEERYVMVTALPTVCVKLFSQNKESTSA